MRKILALSFFLSLNVFACGEDAKEFHPFAVEIISKNKQKQSLKTFEILSPIQKGENFLSSTTALLDDEFVINLDVKEDYKYVGDYYRSYFSVSAKNVDKIEIILAYNTTKKDRSNIIFCGNFKQYKLTQLLEFESANDAPPPPHECQISS